MFKRVLGPFLVAMVALGAAPSQAAPSGGTILGMEPATAVVAGIGLFAGGALLYDVIDDDDDDAPTDGGEGPVEPPTTTPPTTTITTTTTTSTAG
jgi:hypothetical protein